MLDEGPEGDGLEDGLGDGGGGEVEGVEVGLEGCAGGEEDGVLREGDDALAEGGAVDFVEGSVVY